MVRAWPAPSCTATGTPTRSPPSACVAADPARTALIGTDGVFSMDGDLAPVPELARAAHAQQAWLLVDDAHGLGVIGASGRGTLEHFNLGVDAVPVLIGTLGKAFGSYGAFVAGSSELIEFLIQKARSYIYTTALPQPVAAASRAALALIRTEGWRRERLAAHIGRFRELALNAGVPLMASTTPIQPVLLGSAAAALTAQRQLEAAGLCVWRSVRRRCRPVVRACASRSPPRTPRRSSSGSSGSSRARARGCGVRRCERPEFSDPRPRPRSCAAARLESEPARL